MAIWPTLGSCPKCGEKLIKFKVKLLAGQGGLCSGCKKQFIRTPNRIFSLLPLIWAIEFGLLANDHFLKTLSVALCVTFAFLYASFGVPWTPLTSEQTRSLKKKPQFTFPPISPLSLILIAGTLATGLTLMLTRAPLPVYKTVQHNKGAASSLSFNSTASKLLALFRDGSLQTYEPHTGKQLANLSGQTKLLTSASFADNGKVIVTCSNFPKKDNEINVWNADNGANTLKISIAESCQDAAFSHDDKCIHVALYTGTHIVFDATTGKEVRRITFSKNRITGKFSRDGQYFSGTELGENTYSIWNSESAELIYSFKNLKDQTQDAHFFTDSKHAALATDLSIRILNIPNRKITKTFHLHSKTLTGHTLTLSSAEQLIGRTSGNSTEIQSMETGNILTSFNRIVQACDISPSGTYFATLDDKNLYIHRSNIHILHYGVFAKIEFWIFNILTIWMLFTLRTDIIIMLNTKDE